MHGVNGMKYNTMGTAHGSFLIIHTTLYFGLYTTKYSRTELRILVKGCGMGTLFVLVSPCFRENVVVTKHAKLGLFLCSLDNLLQKNVIVFFFGNQISK